MLDPGDLGCDVLINELQTVTSKRDGMHDSQPILCANLIVKPNRDHASRNFPLLVKYGPIMINVSMHITVGRLMKDAHLRACMAAATISTQLR